MKAITVITTIFISMGIKTLIIAGDFCDYFGVSGHEKNPDIGISFEEELVACEVELLRLSELFEEVIFIIGNHENRLERFIHRQAPALYKRATLEKLMNLDLIKNLKVSPYDPDQGYQFMRGGPVIRHEPPASNARLALNKAKGIRRNTGQG